jgi:hypothetical protein
LKKIKSGDALFHQLQLIMPTNYLFNPSVFYRPCSNWIRIHISFCYPYLKHIH